VSPDALLVFMVLGILYFLVVVPARNRKQRSADIKDHLKPGAEIITTSGIYGRVDRVTDTDMYVEIAPGTVVRFRHDALRKIFMPKPAQGAPDKIDNPDRPQDDGPSPPKAV
jgi:preprotein translocase subunit YajC